jgi:hypothetical protein
MRILSLALLAAAALTGAASAADTKSCGAQWTAQQKSGARTSQTRAQFMKTCQAAGPKGGAPQPVSPGGEPAPR